ncbi:MAG: TRAP transporter substrate-binding protein [Thermodesulfobacteriota bacterium]|jgi:TRAP-type C4-dicarboxylate transport system substrate-binding protein
MKLPSILSLLGAGLAVGLLATGALASDKISLTYANFPPAPTFPSVQMEKWRETVEARTGGKVAVKTFPGSTLLDAKGMMDGVIDGVADIGCLAFPYQPGRFELLEGVDLPVGFTSSKVANAVLWDLYVKYQPKSLEKVKILALFTAPPAQVMSKTPIRALADLKGYELRATGAGVKPLQLLGATPVAMPQSETPEALQKGIVKGVFSSLDVLKDFNFAEMLRYATITDMQTTSFGVVMNRKKWDALPDDVKKVFDDAAREHSLWVGEYVDNHGRDSVQWSVEKYGLEVIRLAPEEYQKVHETMKPVIDEWVAGLAAKGFPAREFVGDLFVLKGKYEAELGK